MLTDVGDNLAGALAEAGNLIPVELIPELDLMPPGEAAAEFGELAGSAVDGAGDALGAMATCSAQSTSARSRAPPPAPVAGPRTRAARRGAAADAGGAVADAGRRGRTAGATPATTRAARSRWRWAADAGGAAWTWRPTASAVDAGGAIVDVGAEGGDALCACCARWATWSRTSVG